jgi:hypothetical protein
MGNYYGRLVLKYFLNINKLPEQFEKACAPPKDSPALTPKEQLKRLLSPLPNLLSVAQGHKKCFHSAVLSKF